MFTGTILLQKLCTALNTSHSCGTREVPHFQDLGRQPGSPRLEVAALLREWLWEFRASE